MRPPAPDERAEEREKMTYKVDAREAGSTTIKAASLEAAKDAAREWILAGDFGNPNEYAEEAQASDDFVNITITDEDGEEEEISINLCTEWAAPRKTKEFAR
jgi:hypothetical protein